MSFNIRWASPNDGENVWANRKEMAIEAILTHQADVIGLQEVTHAQLLDLRQGLPAYDFCGVGRADGKERGEYSPIFFKKERFELIQTKTLWLSETPTKIASRGWDAALPRIMTYAELKDRTSARTFFVFNTHFDHLGKRARAESARLILDQISRVAEGQPVLLTGDFNATTEEMPFRILTADLSDAKSLSPKPDYGSKATFNGFGKAEDNPVIDYVFVNRYWKVKQHEILEIRKDSLYISDHYPVLVRLEN